MSTLELLRIAVQAKQDYWDAMDALEAQFTLEAADDIDELPDGAGNKLVDSVSWLAHAKHPGQVEEQQLTWVRNELGILFA